MHTHTLQKRNSSYTVLVYDEEGHVCENRNCLLKCSNYHADSKLKKKLKLKKKNGYITRDALGGLTMPQWDLPKFKPRAPAHFPKSVTDNRLGPDNLSLKTPSLAREAQKANIAFDAIDEREGEFYTSSYRFQPLNQMVDKR